MGETMTMAEIEERFPDEWVLIEDPETTRQLEVLSGRLLWHSKDREELDRKALELRPRHSAILFLGEPAEGMEFAL